MCFPRAYQISTFCVCHARKVRIISIISNNKMCEKTLKQNQSTSNSLPFLRKKTEREEKKRRRTKMNPDSQCSASLFFQAILVKSGKEYCHWMILGMDEKSDALFFALRATNMRVLLSKYRPQVPGTWKQLSNKKNKIQLCGLGWNCCLFLSGQDWKIKVNYQISSSAVIPRGLRRIFLYP